MYSYEGVNKQAYIRPPSISPPPLPPMENNQRPPSPPKEREKKSKKRTKSPTERSTTKKCDNCGYEVKKISKQRNLREEVLIANAIKTFWNEHKEKILAHQQEQSAKMDREIDSSTSSKASPSDTKQKKGKKPGAPLPRKRNYSEHENDDKEKPINFRIGFESDEDKQN